MLGNRLKVATCNATDDGYHNPEWNARRTKTLKEAVEAAANLGSKFVCFPAGFLCVKSHTDLHRKTTALRKIARETGVTLVLGIDVDPGTHKKLAQGKRVSARQSFAVACTPYAKGPFIWRQRSSTRANQKMAANCERKQIVKAKGFQLGVITCGELFNERIRRALISATPHAAVDLCHRGQGFRSHGPMERIARSGIPCVWAGHVNKRRSIKQAFESGGRNLSCPDSDAVVSGKPRIEIKVWNLTSS